jgi:hypothetical protein
LLALKQRGRGPAPGVTPHQVSSVAAHVLGGAPLVVKLLLKLYGLEFGPDFLAVNSIVTATVLGEYLAGTPVCADALRRRGAQTVCGTERRRY